jgi:hypothetical protein
MNGSLLGISISQSMTKEDYKLSSLSLAWSCMSSSTPSKTPVPLTGDKILSSDDAATPEGLMTPLAGISMIRQVISKTMLIRTTNHNKLRVVNLRAATTVHYCTVYTTIHGSLHKAQQINPFTIHLTSA